MPSKRSRRLRKKEEKQGFIGPRRPSPQASAAHAPSVGNTAPNAYARKTVSYLSDDDEQLPTLASTLPAMNNVKRSHDDLNGEQEATAATSTMPGPYSYTVERRRNEGHWDNKRQKTKHESGERKPRFDSAFGQHSVFPELDNEDDGGDDEVDNGVTYLRSVRSEANGLARVVRALAGTRVTTGEGPADNEEDVDATYEDDEDGYYSDGAYVALPDGPVDGDAVGNEPERTVQSQYHDALFKRFEAHRERMRIKPPANEVDLLGDLPTSFRAYDSLAEHEWRYTIRETDPLPAQINSMDTATVMRLFPLLAGYLEVSGMSNKNISERLCTWIWALLGRLDDVGLLQTTMVGQLRDLAKTAIWVGCLYRQKSNKKAQAKKEAVATEEYLDQAESKFQEDKETLSAAKARLLEDLQAGTQNDEVADHDDHASYGVIATLHEQLADSKPPNRDATASTSHVKHGNEAKDSSDESPSAAVPDMQTLAILEFIITVVGQYYGQKDLLDSRMVWEEAG